MLSCDNVRYYVKRYILMLLSSSSNQVPRAVVGVGGRRLEPSAQLNKAAAICTDSVLFVGRGFDLIVSRPWS